jgi:hypothetical protein
MAIYFRCSACGGEHRSQFQLGKSFLIDPSNRFENNSEPCPTTGKQITLNKPDLFWKDEN